VAAGGTVVLSSGAKVTLNANGSLTYDQNGAYAGLSQFGTGAPNSVAIESFSYVLESGRSAEVNVVIRGVASAGDVIAGDSGNNVLAGTAGDDRFSLAQGGDDTVSGLGGNDEFAFGKAFTAADRIDGGSGSDVLVLHGAYSSGVRLSANTLVNVETISLLSSPAGGYFGYNLTLHDGNVAAGAVLTVDGSKLRFGEALMLYGQAELDGGLIVSGGSSHDWIFGSQGADTIQGGLGRDRMWGNGGDDTFSVVGLDQFAGDRIDGGDGSDTLVLQGAMSAGIRFEADTMVNVETITLVSASTGYNSYNLTPHNATVAAGQTLTIDGSALQRGETMMIYGTAETDGRFVMRGGAGNDYLFGGAGDDVLIGGLGRDQLRGNGGADTFVYSGASQSTGTNFDRIVGFDWREDRIDLPDTVAGWNGAVDGALNAASFDADIAAAVNATLDAGSALLFTATSGNYSGRAFLVIDADGDGSYSAGQDYLMELVSPAVPLPGTTEFFV
ncbi:MAG: calcium-binding protein, partial [Allosphingosinicella sp.]